MNFSHLNLASSTNTSQELICNLASIKLPKQTYSFKFRNLNLDDVLVHSKLHNEDDSDDY